MKSHTDLVQSKRLAEILPLESADAFYIVGKKPVDIVPIYGSVTHQHLIEQMAYKRAVPCWSLAALLGVLPKTINFGFENDSTFSLNSLENGKYLADYYEISYVKDNPVDACVDMIIKLKEKGLL